MLLRNVETFDNEFLRYIIMNSMRDFVMLLHPSDLKYSFVLLTSIHFQIPCHQASNQVLPKTVRRELQTYPWHHCYCVDYCCGCWYSNYLWPQVSDFFDRVCVKLIEI